MLELCAAFKANVRSWLFGQFSSGVLRKNAYYAQGYLQEWGLGCIELRDGMHWVLRDTFLSAVAICFSMPKGSPRHVATSLHRAHLGPHLSSSTP